MCTYLYFLMFFHLSMKMCCMAYGLKNKKKKPILDKSACQELTRELCCG